jgi:endonuclease/exonuclease/phosphatase family metal-dependent hydrolase
VKIVTYNLRFGGAGRNHWSKVLEEVDPDIFLTQESYPPNQHLWPLLDAGLHCHASWSPVGKQHWGSAVYIKGCKPTKLDLQHFGGNVVGVEVPGSAWSNPEGCRLRIFSVHAPDQGGDQALHAILDEIAGVRDGCDLVIGGDFNLTISERHESEPRQTCEAVLRIQARLRDEFGLINCWQTAHPNEPLVQTLRWSGNKETPYHCDGIFVPASWKKRLQRCTVMSDDEWDKMSDHSPVMAEFE